MTQVQFTGSSGAGMSERAKTLILGALMVVLVGGFFVYSRSCSQGSCDNFNLFSKINADTLYPQHAEQSSFMLVDTNRTLLATPSPAQSPAQSIDDLPFLR